MRTILGKKDDLGRVGRLGLALLGCQRKPTVLTGRYVDYRAGTRIRSCSPCTQAGGHTNELWCGRLAGLQE